MFDELTHVNVIKVDLSKPATDQDLSKRRLLLVEHIAALPDGRQILLPPDTMIVECQ
jgi:hypothetical protein